jgi:hypothetical protein
MRSKKLHNFFLFLMLAGTMGLLSCAKAPLTSSGGFETIPLPKDINIISPSADLSKEIRAFSGKWQGTWIGFGIGRKGILIVEEIGAQEAKIILAAEEDPSSQYGGGAEFKRYKAKVSSDPIAKIEFKTSLGSPILFEMQKNLKSLKGYFQSSRGGIIYSATTIMERAN